MLLLAIEHQLDRRVCGLRQPRAQQSLHVGAELAAEAAAHELRDDAHVGLRDLEPLRESFARAVDRLRRHPRRQVVAVPLAHAAVCLERCVRLHLRRVGAFNGERSCLEPRREIAVFLGRAPARVRGREDLRSFRTHRLFDVGQRRQYFPLRLDHAQGVFRLLLGRRCQRADLLAGKHHLVARLDRDEQRFHARRLLRRGCIDALQPRMRVWRSQDAPVDHPRSHDVVGVLRASRHLHRTVDARHTRPEQARLFGPGILVVLWRTWRRLDFWYLISHGSLLWLTAPLSARQCSFRIDRDFRRAPSSLAQPLDSDSSRSARP